MSAEKYPSMKVAELCLKCANKCKIIVTSGAKVLFCPQYTTNNKQTKEVESEANHNGKKAFTKN